jgi:hypothetical protein
MQVSEFSESWARGAIMREPLKEDYIGLSYETASRRMQAMCAIAAETGRTVNASHHLNKLRDIFLMV